MSTIVEPVAPPRPAPDEPRPYSFPAFESRTLPNGLRIIVAPVTKLPVASVLAIIDAGAGIEPHDREGVAQLTAKALIEGTATRDGAAITDEAERLGGALESTADWDAATIKITVLSERIEPALRLVAEVLRTPAFPGREIDRLKSERQAELLQLRAEPRGLADEMIERFAYAPSARYARPEGGTAASVEALTRADVDAFYHARYAPNAVTLIVVGNVTTDQIEALAKSTLGDWNTKATAPALTVLDTGAGDPPAIRIVRKADAPQSEIRVGHVGLPRSHREYFPVLIMNAVLGGLFSSRINLNLREVHAYTYGAHSVYDWRRGAGPFAVSTAVQSDVTDGALREILSEITRIRAEPVEMSELSLATSYLDGVFPIRYETASAIATAIGNMVIYRLPADYYDQYRSNVRAVGTADVLAAARAHVDPSRLQVVIVGDPSAIREPLERLGAGPVLVYDDTGRPL